MIKFAQFTKELNLETIVATEKKSMDVRLADFNRPGMQLCNFYEYFAHHRPQVIGKVEMTYLESLDAQARYDSLARYMSYDLPCIIVCWDMMPMTEMIELAEKNNIPLFKSQETTTKLCQQVVAFLNRELAPQVTMHAVLVDVFGIGVLITGDSGVGKSEAALELLKRGHRLCADDVVRIGRVSDDRLVGEAPESVRHFMEIRGIGIINIQKMYGVSAVIISKTIYLCIHMEKWDKNKEYDRLGLNEEYKNILDVKVPYSVLPVKPGRNVAIIIEVAARNLGLKRIGYSAAQELDERLKELIEKNSKMEEN